MFAAGLSVLVAPTLRFVVFASCLILVGCALAAVPSTSERVPGGNPQRGQHALAAYGCGACHVIPGVPAARGQVGPPLTGLGQRTIIAGRLHNDATNLIAWVQHPQLIAPGVDMPDLGITDGDARDIAAYLLTLN